MTTFELAGEAMLQMHEGNRSIARVLASFFRPGRGAAPESMSGATFLEQEPDLVAEARLPAVMRTI